MNVSALLTQHEAAKQLGVSTRTLQRWVKAKYFPPPHRIGRGAFYRPGEVANWINNQLHDDRAISHERKLSKL